MLQPSLIECSASSCCSSQQSTPSNSHIHFDNTTPEQKKNKRNSHKVGPYHLWNGVMGPYKWPYKWVTGLLTLLIAVIIPFISGRGPPSSHLLGLNSPKSQDLTFFFPGPPPVPFSTMVAISKSRLHSA